MANIIAGILPDGNTQPIGATKEKRLKVEDSTEKELQLAMLEVLLHIRQELMILNDYMAPPCERLDLARQDKDSLYNDPRGFYSNAWPTGSMD